ncbi:CocE/NonD family hydrolase [Phaeobacter sp. BS52]
MALSSGSDSRIFGGHVTHITVIENEWIVLPDGRRLATRIWIPAGTGPFPVILEYLPYRKRDATASRDQTTHGVFAAAGYACVRVDIAGTGDSDGVFDDEYSQQELSDGEAVLAWISCQDWCDANIGMIGISWGGFNGLQLAYRQPPALRAVVSVASTTDRYADDIHFMGGCLLSDNVNWAGQMFAYNSRPPDPLLRSDWREVWQERMENLPFMAADWLAHPNRDAFWKHGSVCEDYARIKVPVLATTGWADAYVNAPSQLAAHLNGPAKALMGPWEHRYAHMSKLGASDFHSEVLGWFDRWLKAEENGAEDLPDYRVFMQEHFDPTQANKPRKGRWIAEQRWPSPNVTPRMLWLGNNGLSDRAENAQLNVSTAADVGQASGVFCPGMRIDNELAGDQSGDDARSVCFDLPLDASMELLGRAVLKIAFTVDQPAAQIVARLCDVSADGVSQRISYRAFNLSHHAGHDRPETLVPGQRYEVEFALNECAHHLRAGHRLRLALSNSYWPIVWPAPVRTNVMLDLAGCALTLPVRSVIEEIDPCAPGAPQLGPTSHNETLRAADARVSTVTQADGTIVQETFDDFGATRDPDHGMEVGSHVTTRYSIHPDDPVTACFQSAWNFAFRRKDWQVEINTENAMTCDTQNFYLHRKLRATEGATRTEVLTKEWSQTIPRGHL